MTSKRADALALIARWARAVEPPALDPTDAKSWAGAGAIVVLGRRLLLLQGRPALGRHGQERVAQAALVHRATGLPILVSGGDPGQLGRSEAEVMARALEDEHAVPVRWREGRSRDTLENAKYSAHILRDENIRRILLVTHAAEYARAAENFARVGLEPIPAALGFFHADAARPSAPEEVAVLLYETLARVRDRLVSR